MVIYCQQRWPCTGCQHSRTQQGCSCDQNDGAGSREIQMVVEHLDPQRHSIIPDKNNKTSSINRYVLGHMVSGEDWRIVISILPNFMQRIGGPQLPFRRLWSSWHFSFSVAILVSQSYVYPGQLSTTRSCRPFSSQCIAGSGGGASRRRDRSDLIQKPHTHFLAHSFLGTMTNHPPLILALYLVPSPSACLHNPLPYFLTCSPRLGKLHRFAAHQPPSTHSPDLNPIEHLWDELDRRVRARQARLKSTVQLIQCGMVARACPRSGEGKAAGHIVESKEEVTECVLALVSFSMCTQRTLQGAMRNEALRRLMMTTRCVKKVRGGVKLVLEFLGSAHYRGSFILGPAPEQKTTRKRLGRERSATASASGWLPAARVMLVAWHAGAAKCRLAQLTWLAGDEKKQATFTEPECWTTRMNIFEVLHSDGNESFSCGKMKVLYVPVTRLLPPDDDTLMWTTKSIADFLLNAFIFSNHFTAAIKSCILHGREVPGLKYLTAQPPQAMPPPNLMPWYISEFGYPTHLPPSCIRFNPRAVHSGFLQVRIMPDDATDRRVFSGIFRFIRSFILKLLITHLASPSSALKTSVLRFPENLSPPQVILLDQPAIDPGHGDNLAFLFYLKSIPYNPKGNDNIAIRHLTSICMNFAVTGRYPGQLGERVDADGCNNVHATLDNCFKPPINFPSDYVARMRLTRPTKPYTVNVLEHFFFKNYKEISTLFSLRAAALHLSGPFHTPLGRAQHGPLQDNIIGTWSRMQIHKAGCDGTDDTYVSGLRVVALASARLDL
ncbi:hypothetical protein PR048_005474 [Dryococelus australis]|uniref:Uncharacterized protein n=1 Tax=Dryococelus australis TaxID=614101 RepID=A0ABQ9I8D4_9NEOP|nr:hypothetical protein PR048_005474 [Dryococelus australis]